MPHKTLRIETGTKKERVVGRMIDHYLFHLLKEPFSKEDEVEAKEVAEVKRELGYGRQAIRPIKQNWDSFNIPEMVATHYRDHHWHPISTGGGVDFPGIYFGPPVLGSDGEELFQSRYEIWAKHYQCSDCPDSIDEMVCAMLIDNLKDEELDEDRSPRKVLMFKDSEALTTWVDAYNETTIMDILNTFETIGHNYDA